MAVRVGFEPTEPVKVQRFSRPPDSTTLAPHRALLTYRVSYFFRNVRPRGKRSAKLGLGASSHIRPDRLDHRPLHSPHRRLHRFATRPRHPATHLRPDRSSLAA